MTTGEKIHTIRNLQGLTREAMAERLHLSIQGYGKIERGEVKLEGRLPQIAEALGVTEEFIKNFKRENLVVNVSSHNTSTNSSTSQNGYNIVTIDEGVIEALTTRLKSMEAQQEKLYAMLETALKQNEELQRKILDKPLPLSNL